MLYVQYKSQLNFRNTSIKRSQSDTNDEEYKENTANINNIDEAIFFFQQFDLESIKKGIIKLKITIESSSKSIFLQSFFKESEIINYLFDFIENETLSNSLKIEIVNILNDVIDWYTDDDIEQILKLSFIHNLFDLLMFYYPYTNKEKEKIKSSQIILIFLTKLSNRTKQSRNLILQNYPNSNLEFPFKQLFEFIKDLSEIESLQQFYIRFFSSLCYYKFDFDTSSSIYNEYVINFFDESIVHISLWDDLLQIISYFTHYHHGKVVGHIRKTYEILETSLIQGNSEAKRIAFEIMNKLIDYKFDLVSFLDYSELCSNITSGDQEISIRSMNLIEILLHPDKADTEEEEEEEEISESFFNENDFSQNFLNGDPPNFLKENSTTPLNENENNDENPPSFPQGSQTEKVDDNDPPNFFNAPIQISPYELNTPLQFLLNNGLLPQLKKILYTGSITQKVAALQVILSIFEEQQKTCTPLKISDRIVKEELIPPMIETIENDDLRISKIVCIILSTILECCIDEEIQASIVQQIDQYGENVLEELLKKTYEIEDDDGEFSFNVEHILNKLKEIAGSEDVTLALSLNLAGKENDDDDDDDRPNRIRNYDDDDNDDENGEIPFNQGGRRRSNHAAYNSLF